MDRIPVLLDTDIGSDIDDAMALAYLLKHPKCDLLGITVVTGDVQERAALAEVLCRAAGHSHIPIHCGRRDVLVEGPGQPRVPQYEAIRNVRHRMDRPENTAVEFLRQTIRFRPGEITLLSIGPFGNIALLFALDPEIPMLLKSFVSMAGVFYAGSRGEWNAVCDPTSSSIVAATPRKDHLWVGLDVTTKCTMEADEVRHRFVGEPLKTVASFAETWFKGTKTATFHDPLAAALIFHPGLCSYESGKVTIGRGETAGYTTIHEGDGHDRVAKEVDSKAFFDEYFRIASS